MSNYTKTYDGATKDSTNAVITGADFDAEFNLIQTAVNSKFDSAGGTITGTTVFSNAVAIDVDGNEIKLDTDGNTSIQASTNDQIDWKIGGTVRHVFAGQNVGFGVTALEGWGASFSTVQVGGTGALVSKTAAGVSNDIYLLQNAYFDGTNWKYQVTDEASIYRQQDGMHTFFVAASGTADTTITWASAFTVLNTGRTQFDQPIGVGASGASQAIVAKPSAVGTTNALIVQDSVGTIRTRIDQDGITGLRSGTTPAGVLEIGDNGTTKGILCKITADNSVPYGLVIGNDTFSTTDTDGLAFFVGNTGAASIRARGTNAVLQLGGSGSENDLVINADRSITLAGATGTVVGAGTLNAQQLYENGVRAKVGSVPNAYHDYGTTSAGSLAVDFSTYGFIKFSQISTGVTVTPTWPNFPGEEDRLFLNASASVSGAGTLVNTGLSTNPTATSVNIPADGVTRVYTLMPAPSGWPAAVSWIVVSIDT